MPPDLVRAPLGMFPGWLEQIAAQLANIDDHRLRHGRRHHPNIGRQKNFTPQYHRCAAEQGAALTNRNPPGPHDRGAGDVNASRPSADRSEMAMRSCAGRGHGRCAPALFAGPVCGLYRHRGTGPWPVQWGAVALVRGPNQSGNAGEGAIQILPELSVPVPQASGRSFASWAAIFLPRRRARSALGK